MDIKNKTTHLTQDELIVDHVKDQLEEEMQGSAMDINVACRDGSIQLSGMVDVLAEKKFAEEVTRGVDGVRRVENGLTVCMDGQINDRHMEKEIRDNLFTSESKNSVGRVGVKVNDGVASLVGHTRTLKDAHLAMAIASKVRGVKDVVNNINITTVGEYDDVTINNTIHQRIGNNDIACDVNNGIVHLIGFANNRSEVEFAREVAMDVEGVRKVRNRVKIRKDS
ncbi:BON domain-containing protein [Sporosalibacterium faouarense]|uniref:BON domain-containing protein n=1 Tax=Sporosalibacterium faouarense TaxID=516123 RepID=UPI00141C8BE0|nr:BON domain-containing protein [Sporosalibacterium faouarense]MTI47805.1 BON domain-containing protein [Bacillota bacterium]